MLANTETWRPALARFQRIALIVGGVGALLCVLGAFLGPAQFFYSFMFAFFFWMMLTFGAAIVLMVQHLTGGVWGLMLRRMLEAAFGTMPLIAALFLVVVLGAALNIIYPWTRPEVIAESPVVQFKAASYLNIPFWLARAVIYFAIWIGMAFLLNRWSTEQDRNPDPELARRMRTLSGPGIVIIVLTWTLALTDWGMSLEPEWFSSMYAVTFIVEGMLAVFAWSVIALYFMSKRNLLPYTIPVNRLHDIGTLMFAFIVLWTYVNFSQYLIVWSGNIPEETFWYGYRIEGGWQILAVLLIFGHFFLPFFALLSRRPKRNINTLVGIAYWIVAIQIVFVFWSIVPAFFHGEGLRLHWLDPVTLIGVGGLWMALFARNLMARPLLPPNDHRLPELERQSAGEAHGHARGHSHGEAPAASH